MVNKGYMDADKTEAGDERYTPSYAVLPLLEFLPPPAEKVIWCPFDKSWSEYVRILTGAGYKVIWSHIDDRKDFLHTNQSMRGHHLGALIFVGICFQQN